MYEQKNLEKLLNECYAEIEEKLANTYYKDYFNFKKDKITIQKGHTTGNVLGRCNYYGITYDRDYWGRCSIKDIDRFVITIYDHKDRDTIGIKETIIHELIHTLKGCQNHKSEFKYMCSIIKQYLGYSCLSGKHEDTQNLDYKIGNYQHFLICPKCKKIVSQSNRKTKKFQYPQFYYHSECRTTLQYVDRITLIKMKEKGEI